jgi:hypothetical protein
MPGLGTASELVVSCCSQHGRQLLSCFGSVQFRLAETREGSRGDGGLLPFRIVAYKHYRECVPGFVEADAFQDVHPGSAVRIEDAIDQHQIKLPRLQLLQRRRRGISRNHHRTECRLQVMLNRRTVRATLANAENGGGHEFSRPEVGGDHGTTLQSVCGKGGPVK